MRRFMEWNTLLDALSDRKNTHNVDELTQRLKQLEVNQSELINHQPSRKEKQVSLDISMQSASTDADDEEVEDIDSDDGIFYSSSHTPVEGRSGTSSPSTDELSEDISRSGRSRSISSSTSTCSTVSSGNTTSSSSRRYNLPLSALQMAAYDGNVVATNVLLNSGANPYQRVSAKGYEFTGMTAGEIAEQRGHFEVAHSLDVAPLDALSFNTIPSSLLDSSPKNSYNKPSLGIGSHDGYKKPSEDRMVVMPVGILGMMLYCVFDGHNGKHLSETVSLCLPAKIRQSIQELYSRIEPHLITPAVLSELLERCFVSLDTEIMQQAGRNFILRKGGTTAVVLLETCDHIICANLGDSPAAVFDVTTGQLLAITEDHTPQNSCELRRVLANGALIVPNPEYGDMRVCSPTKQSTISVTRAMGQYEFKHNVPAASHTVTAVPQCYVWSKDEMLSRCRSKENAELFFTLYSDSFTEAVVDSRSADASSHSPNRASQIIANVVAHDQVISNIARSLRKHGKNCTLAAKALAFTQANKFLINGSFCGDNTSIIIGRVSL